MHKKILLAEDDNDMRRFLAKALENAGFEVTSYDNGLSAYQRLREEPFELLLTDIVMPEMDGIELARRASELDPDIKIMFITGFAAVALNSDSQAPKNAKVLSKPVHLRELVNEVQKMLASVAPPPERPPPQSTVTPAVFTTSCHLPRSSLTKAPKPSGVVGDGTAPSSKNFALVSASSRKVFISAPILSTIDRGVAACTNIPCQAEASNPGSVSAMAGTSGALGERSSVDMPSACTFPPFTCGSTSVMLSSASWM